MAEASVLWVDFRRKISWKLVDKTVILKDLDKLVIIDNVSSIAEYFAVRVKFLLGLSLVVH
eukprot:1243188-Ditylum_brightwellii.AAC.1